MSNKWVVDAQHPQGYLVPMTPAEQADFDAFQAAEAIIAAQQATYAANAATMRANLVAAQQPMLDAVTLLGTGTATLAQTQNALILTLRGCLRLSRLVLSMLDAAP